MTNFFSAPTKAKNTEVLVTHVLIVDDQKVVRARIEEVLSPQQNIKIVGTAKNGEKAIAQVDSLKPDVILIDIEMPGMDGIEVIKILSHQYPQLKILVISSHDKEDYVRQTIAKGADGYVLKHTSAADLISAIHAVHGGGSYLGEGLLKKVQQVDKANSSKVTKKFSPKQKNPQDSCRLVDKPSLSPRSDLNSDRYTETANTDIKQLEQNLSVVEVEEFLPSIGKWITWGGMAVMIVIALIIPVSSVLKYKTKVKVSATIRPEGEVRLVQAKTEGQIVDIAAEPGEAVEKGDILATIDPFELKSQKRTIEKAIIQQRSQLAQLNSQIANLNRQTIAESDRNSLEILAAQAELDGNIRTYENTNTEVNSQLEEAQAQLKAAEATLEAAKNRQTRYQSVADEGALAKEELAEAELEVIRQQQEVEAAMAGLNTARAAIDPSDAEVEIARQRIRQLEKSGLTAITGLNREKEALVQQRIEIERQIQQSKGELEQINKQLKNTKIDATAKGTISKLELRNPGQLVQVGQEIAQIIPDGEALAINTLVTPEDIGKVELGLDVQMRVSSCAYPDYGVLNGEVTKIANDVTQTENNSQSNSTNSANPSPQTSGAGGNFYKVTVIPESTSFGRKNFKCKLQTGMQGSAEIITREETALQFILRKARLISDI